MKKQITFTECEHHGDAFEYETALTDCGAQIVDSNIDFDEETIDIIIEVEDYPVFFNKFIETESFPFSNLKF